MSYTDSTLSVKYVKYSHRSEQENKSYNFLAWHTGTKTGLANLKCLVCYVVLIFLKVNAFPLDIPLKCECFR